MAVRLADKIGAQLPQLQARDRLQTQQWISGCVLKVVNRIEIAGQDRRYRYSVTRTDVLGDTTYAPQDSTDTQEYIALSVSELSNALPHYSYGIVQIPNGFSAQPIPTGSIVFGFPFRLFDGSFAFIIVNTQAIDGQCTGALTGDYDYGGFTYETYLNDDFGDFDAPQGNIDLGTFGVVDGGTFSAPDADLDFLTFATGGSAENYLFGVF